MCTDTVTESPRVGSLGPRPATLNSPDWLPVHKGDRKQAGSWGGGGHVPGGPITSCLAQADLTPQLTTGHRGFLHCPPCRPACPLSIALGGWFPKANMIISLAVKSCPWTPMALRTKPCSQLPGTCLLLPCGLGGFQAHLHCIPVSPPPARLHDPISADNVTEAGTGSVTSAVSPTGKATILPISAGNPVHPGPGLSLTQA